MLRIGRQGTVRLWRSRKNDKVNLGGVACLLEEVASIDHIEGNYRPNTNSYGQCSALNLFVRRYLLVLVDGFINGLFRALSVLY